MKELNDILTMISLQISKIEKDPSETWRRMAYLNMCKVLQSLLQASYEKLTDKQGEELLLGIGVEKYPMAFNITRVVWQQANACLNPNPLLTMVSEK